MDGYDPSTKTVHEFHGCEFHGCRKCKPNNRHVKTFHRPNRTVEEMFQTTKGKTELLRAAGYTVIEMWECAFKKELKQNEELKDLVKNKSWVSPLDPREAFYGGRTGMAKCYHAVESLEEIIKISQVCIQPSTNMARIRQVIHKSWSIRRVKTSMITLV